ncbi:MAG: acyltransferase, partial [Prevotella sp.]|nr:acyltransferase [Prevotella sp.]
EGTRSANADWKKGFLVIAKKADIPILLYGVDYERKLIECTETVIPSDDIEGDLSRIKAYFKNFKGKHPENFKV